MSTTAGLAAQEYVAINNLAVASTLLGLATALAFLATPFLVIGLAGIVCGMMALRQIRNSNGTQTGRGLARAGIGLSVAVVGGVLAVVIAYDMTQRTEKAAVNAVLDQFGRRVMAGDYAGAHALFDRMFQDRVPLHRFEQHLRLQQDPGQGFGRLTAFYGNNFFEFSTADGQFAAATKAIFRFEKLPNDGRAVIALRKDPASGQWRILRHELLDGLLEPPRR